MKIYLDKLRAKPEASRRRLAFAFSLMFTLAITGAWLTSLRYSLRQPVLAAKEEDSALLVAVAEVVPEVGVWQRVKSGWQIMAQTARDLTANVIRR